MVIYIRLKVLQNQQVCIPEPNGDVLIVERRDKDKDDRYIDDDKYIDIEVGFDPERGMIGREVSIYKHDEE